MGKPWSPARARAAMYAAQTRAYQCSAEGHEDGPGADEVDEAHLRKAYLAGASAATARASEGYWSACEFYNAERARLLKPAKKRGGSK